MVLSVLSKARTLLSGNVRIYALLAMDIAALLFCANLLPLLYDNTLADIIRSYAQQYERTLNFSAATVIFFIVCALRFSMTSSAGRYFCKRAKGENTEVSDFFYYLSPDVFFSNFLFRVKLSAVKFAGLLFCFIPFAASCVFLYRLFFGVVSARIVMVAFLTAAAFFLAGIAFYLSFSSSLFLCPYIFFEGKKKRFLDIVSESQRIMAKKRRVLNRIRLSFFGWFFLCIFIVPIIYVWGLYNQTKAVAARCFLGG